MAWHMTRLLGIDDVHYHSAFQHLCQPSLYIELCGPRGAVRSLAIAVGVGFVVEHSGAWKGSDVEYVVKGQDSRNCESRLLRENVGM